MLPFFQPGEDIWFKPVSINFIQPGDIITYQEKPYVFVTHRVIKITKHNGKIAFITKGDNRFHWDPLVENDQIVGKVIRAGNRNLNRFWWRWLGRMIAFLSYLQGNLYQRMIQSRLNQFRHHLAQKGLFPKINPFAVFRMISSPLFWITYLRNYFSDWKSRRLMSSQTITIKEWLPEDNEILFKIWNENFPEYRTSQERFNQKFCGGRGFNPSNCFILHDKKNILGWTSANPKGVIDVLAVTHSAVQDQAAKILIQENLNQFKQNKVKTIYVGPQRLRGDTFEIQHSPFFTALTKTGFYPYHMNIELSLTRSEYRKLSMSSQPNLEFTQKPDSAALNHFFDRNKIEMEQTGGKNETTGGLAGILKNKIVCYCRFLTDTQVENYRDINWVWSISEPKVPTGYFFRLIVDEELKRKGIGTITAMKAFKSLFDAGCETIILAVNQNGFYERFYERFGFRKKGCYVAWKRN